jgi:hypothetical protein
MAPSRTWLPRAEEIIEVLRKMRSKELDRAAVEELFQLQRRAALTLMEQVGASPTRGKAWTLPRASLLSWVERVYKEDAWQLERRADLAADLSQSMAEVQAIREALRQAGRPPVRFTVVQEVLSASCATVSPNVSITPGRIVIQTDRHDAAVQACELLYELGLAIANDFDGLHRLIAVYEPA